MAAPDEIGRRAYAARIAQKLAGPAEAILGYQELIVEAVVENGPAEALDDLQKVLTAARDLNALIARLLGERVEMADDDGASLRHDLRTPLNAILGYSEMVGEDFADVLTPRLVADIQGILREGRALLGRIDDIVDFTRTEPDSGDAADATIAAELARTLSARPPATTSQETGRILVIDDMKLNRELLSRRLAGDGHEVETVASGREALDLLQRRAFDLALVDILMPDMNGIELLGRLKADERWREMPVIMVSGLKEDDAVIRCISAGAEDYLPKPVDAVLLRARIDASLQRLRWREREKTYLAEIKIEKERADALLNAILPGQIVRRLANGEAVIADRFDAATIVFADIVGFTAMAAQTAPAALVKVLGTLFSRFDDLADRHRVEKIKTIGDAYMAAAGLPEPRADHARSAVDFARAILAETNAASGADPPFNLRIGIHSGPVVAGLIGRRRFVYDIWGHTVNLASRLESQGRPGRIQISQSTLDALGNAVEVVPEPMLTLKGIGRMQTYLLAD